MKKTEPMGLPIQAWKDWMTRRDMSVRQFYNMLHGLLGAGLLQRQGSKWHLSEGFTRELKEMLKVYESER